MKGPGVCYPINDVIDFLESKEGEPMSSKFFEIEASIILAKYVSKKKGEEYMIAFPAKEKLRSKFEAVAKIDLEMALREIVDEDSPIDVLLVPMSQYKNRQNACPKGASFQLKRIFSQSKSISLEDCIVHYLNNSVGKKYAKARHTNLVLLLTSKPSDIPEFGEIHVGNVRNRLKFENFPFDRILFLGFQVNNDLVIGEIWPNFGSDSYTEKEFNRRSFG